MRHTLTLCCLPLALLACDSDASFDPGALELSHNRPALPAAPEPVDAYDGDSPIVREAQDTLHNGFSLHANVIVRTCGPTNGVCHNQKEYPDLHTPANFIDAIGAPCNVQPLTPEAVFDRCERPGDRFLLTDEHPELEIAYVDYVPGERSEEERETAPTAESPGLHIYLAGQLSIERESVYESGRFIRTFVNSDNQVEDLPFFSYRSRYWVVGDGGYSYDDGEVGTHLMAEVSPYQTRQIEELLSVGLEEGDLNRNGTLGARASGNPIALIEPGRPEESYIIGRLRGTLGGEVIPGTRMPLANQPLSNAEMLAFFCFVEGLQYVDGPVSLGAPIDYGRCSYSSNPETLELLGSGVTWGGRIARILEFNCGGCHGGASPAADLNLLTGDVHARLLQASAQRPELKLIEPGLPEQSYLFLKVTADPSIEGQPMPVNPLTGMGGLKQQELADMQTWIEEGALLDAEPPEDGPDDADAGAP